MAAPQSLYVMNDQGLIDSLSALLGKENVVMR